MNDCRCRGVVVNLLTSWRRWRSYYDRATVMWPIGTRLPHHHLSLRASPAFPCCPNSLKVTNVSRARYVNAISKLIFEVRFGPNHNIPSIDLSQSFRFSIFSTISTKKFDLIFDHWHRGKDSTMLDRARYGVTASAKKFQIGALKDTPVSASGIDMEIKGRSGVCEREIGSGNERAR